MKKLLLCSLVLLFTCFTLQDRAEINPINFTLKPVIFNPDSVIVDSLTSHGYTKRHATFWVKVARMESNKYTSMLYKYHNNPWGMSYFRSGTRPTNGLYRVYYNGKPTRFAGYKTKEHAIEEIIFYLDAAKYPKDFSSLDEFIKFMKSKNYFEEPIWYYKKALSNV